MSNGITVTVRGKDAMTKSMKRIHTVTIEHKTLGVGAFRRINITAIAEYTILGDHGPYQVMRSGCEYGASPENESALAQFNIQRLGELRNQLHAIGFSQRAISAAFRNVARK